MSARHLHSAIGPSTPPPTTPASTSFPITFTLQQTFYEVEADSSSASAPCTKRVTSTSCIVTQSPIANGYTL